MKQEPVQTACFHCGNTVDLLATKAGLVRFNPGTTREHWCRESSSHTVKLKPKALLRPLPEKRIRGIIKGRNPASDQNS